jgi:hypothetical protein
MHTPKIRPASKNKNPFKIGDLLKLRADDILRPEERGKIYMVLFVVEESQYVKFQRIDEEACSVTHWTHVDKFYQVIA